MSYFQVINDFNAQSANGGRCYLTNLPMQKADPNSPQQQPHEIDQFVLRGPEIAFEGFFDLRPAVIIDTARELFNMSTEAEVQALRDERDELDHALAVAETQNESLNARLSNMILQNAEQIVQLEGVALELQSAYDELYADTDDDLEDADV